jgi:magnesium-transporting ATPase (P-type)
LNIIGSLALSVSLPAIVSIAADRYLMVAYPFKHRYLMSGKKIIAWITFIWILAAFRTFSRVVWMTNFYSLSVDICLAGVLVLITVIFYVMISISLGKQTRNLALHDPDANNSNRSQATRLLKEKQFIRTILFVACIAVIGIVPYTIAYHALTTNGMFLMNQDIVATDVLMGFFTALFYLTFAINPLIYFLRLPRYRKSFYLSFWRGHSN